MRIITGRAGSGKTTMLLREIAEKAMCGEGRQIVLVPELFSHAYERKLAEATDNQGARTAEVLTFSRLTGRVFAETGGLADVMLTPAGRLLTLQKAAGKIEHSLRIYGGASQKPEVLKGLLQVVDEMKCYGVVPETLFDACEAVQGEEMLLSDKLRDLGQLYTVYESLCESTLPDPRDALTLLAQRIPDSRTLDSAEIYLDGFLGFTPQEINVISALMRKRIPLHIAVTCDMQAPELFVSGVKTVKTMLRMAKKCGLSAEHIYMEGMGMQRAHDLHMLEQSGMVQGVSPCRSDGESVHIFAGASPLEECEYVAAAIRRLVREEGARYRDFVVTARDMAEYQAALSLAMERYKVPYFISEKADLLQKPPVALVVSALQAVTGGFRYEDIFACLKTGLCSMLPDEVDRLENYAIIWRIRGSRWEQPFVFHPDGYGLEIDAPAKEALDALNALRVRAIAPFVSFERELREAQTALGKAKALYAFLEEIGAPAQMAHRAQMHEAAGRMQMAEEYRQLWDIIIDATEQFAWALGDTEMDTAQFAALFTMVLGEYDVGAIPVSLDRVTCGAAERVVGEHAKYVFVLGANDGKLPKIPASDGILTETDRMILETEGVALSSYGAEQMMLEQELIYRILAGAKEKLFLSYHLADAAGKEARPSYIIGMVTDLLSGVPVESGAAMGGSFRLEGTLPGVELACAFVSGMETSASRTAYAYYQNDERVKRAKQVKTARGPLTNKEAVAGLYGKRLNLTASRVDTFYSCRFAYFMQYGLRAKSRRQAQFAAPEAGSFIHYVLENTLAEIQALPGGVQETTDDKARSIMKSVVRRYIKEQLGGMEKQTTRFRYLFQRLVKSMEGILQSVLDELRTSEFIPIDYELDFSGYGDLPPAQCADDTTSVALSGKVDRVDGYIKDGKLYVRVMDYKSGKKAFSLSDVWYGLNMQLILYLYALQQEGLDRYREKLSRELEEVVPAGILYVPARDDVLDAERDTDEEALRKMREKALRRSGLVTDDLEVLDAMERGISGEGRFIPVKLNAPKKGKEGDSPALSAASAVAGLARFGKLARYAQGKLLEMGRELSRGSVEADPYQSGQHVYCAWCQFRPACAFDERVGDKARMLKKVENTEFWQRIGGDTDGGEMDG